MRAKLARVARYQLGHACESEKSVFGCDAPQEAGTHHHHAGRDALHERDTSSGAAKQ